MRNNCACAGNRPTVCVVKLCHQNNISCRCVCHKFNTYKLFGGRNYQTAEPEGLTPLISHYGSEHDPGPVQSNSHLRNMFFQRHILILSSYILLSHTSGHFRKRFPVKILNSFFIVSSVLVAYPPYLSLLGFTMLVGLTVSHV